MKINNLTANRIGLLLFGGMMFLVGPSLRTVGAAEVRIGAEGNVVIEGFHGGAWLGAYLEDVTSENMSRLGMQKEQGVILTEIQKDSPAERAGLQPNDVVLNYADIPVFSSQQFVRLIRETPAGRTVTMVISRGGIQQSVSVKIEQPKRHGMHIDKKQFGYKGFDLFDAPFLMRRGAHGRLGVTIQNLTEQMADFLGVTGRKGVLVTSVIPDSAAAKAGLRAGDAIISMENETVNDSGDLHNALRKKTDAGRVTLKIIRDKTPQTIVVELGPRESGLKL